jgi:hypothetical protein
MDNAVRQYMREIGSRGGKRAARRMTKGQRVARAKKAAAAKYANREARRGEKA